MTTLFDSLARNRPEWLAQGLLVHALMTEPAARALVLSAMGLSIPATEVPTVTEEEPTDGGWRADVCVRWADGTLKRFELKLLAGFTPRQLEALHKREVDLLITPAAQSVPPEARTMPHVTWAQLAGLELNDTSLKTLLSQVGTRSTWLLPELNAEMLLRELDAFSRQASTARWEGMYRFLSTVHEYLLDEAPGDYRASDAWTPVRRGAASYYGFCFYLGDADVEAPRFWLGFWRQGTTPVFGVTVPSPKGEPILYQTHDAGVVPTVLEAHVCAKKALAAAQQYIAGLLGSTPH
ncbi:hypothetical protein [Corallococcus sp. CA054B]|uniref:hypothetical protein n=1 Tax=Corallococcus sp. CA054B TaxID=2316734 RepID=UPI000EA2089B|nr:hypothetical protein [Corallococcus sp. CA054B]